MNTQPHSSTHESGKSALFLLLAIAAGALLLLASFSATNSADGLLVYPAAPSAVAVSQATHAEFLACSSPGPTVSWTSEWQFGVCNGNATNYSKPICISDAVAACNSDCRDQIDAANANAQMASDCNNWCQTNNPPGNTCTGVVEAAVKIPCALSSTSGGSHGAPWECTAQGTWEATCKCT